MAAPTAPMPLVNQVRTGQNITVTVPLQALGAAPGFAMGGSTFNAGNPNATYTIAIPGPPGVMSSPIQDLLQQLDDLATTGYATVS